MSSESRSANIVVISSAQRFDSLMRFACHSLPRRRGRRKVARDDEAAGERESHLLTLDKSSAAESRNPVSPSDAEIAENAE